MKIKTIEKMERAKKFYLVIEIFGVLMIVASVVLALLKLIDTATAALFILVGMGTIVIGQMEWNDGNLEIVKTMIWEATHEEEKKANQEPHSSVAS